jgi:asparagine synthase (glutamine-hydrolysing)
MCGIAGFQQINSGSSANAITDIVACMTNTLERRGPDDGDVWVDADAGFAVGHRRLAVVDLSPAGHQPMVSGDGRYVIAYNGEVYNCDDLRPELEQAGCRFRGHSDTEVILEACAAWGVEQTLKRLIGMFAIALWDRRDRSLCLARDRLGIKPLYWGAFDGLFLFGSELKALRAHPGWRPEVDRDVLASFMRFSYVPSPYSIYRGVHKLEPGCFLSVTQEGEPQLHRYWDMRRVVTSGQHNQLDIGDEEALSQLEAVLGDAVQRRMVADVPLGAFLSGGVDSSTVVALMQAHSSRPVRTFSIGFNEQGYNEAVHAKAVAEHLGTDHTELYVEPKQAMAAIPNISKWFDEPFADSSQIPTFLVSEMTRRHVTVSLSGDGGDELFAGYNRYYWADALWRHLGWMSPSLRGMFASGMRSLSPAQWDGLFKMVPHSRRPRLAGDKIHKLADVIAQPSADALYRRLLSQWDSPEGLVLGAMESRNGLLWDEAVANDIPDYRERMQFLDTVTYLPDDILTKVDRASMAVSLEARVPLLDHRVVEFAWRLPMSMKIRGGTSKWLLRQLLYRHVPKNLIERPKMGFGVPLESWLRDELKEWAGDLLSTSSIQSAGYLNADLIEEKWNEHLSGQRNWQYLLWPVLMFQSWLAEYEVS